ncbi:uncharacterized protein LOC117194555 [Drosophila miranda]|uniref:uncharacterized protein LOC117194555 n=1 Tax=Drosophila miranda TaxID=7229 RepID=UPI00143F8CC9|nr:uncharacterized protein LOC117194555 [Drosophila miranda]
MANSSGGGYTIPTGTLSILPIAANAQLPTITTTASGYEPNDVITTIPVSLSIQRFPSSLSIVDLAQEQDGYSNSGSSNGMTVGPGAGGGGGITTFIRWHDRPAPERRHGNGHECYLNPRQKQSRGQDRRGLCLSGGTGHLFRPIHWIIAFVVGLSTPFQNH